MLRVSSARDTFVACANGGTAKFCTFGSGSLRGFRGRGSRIVFPGNPCCSRRRRSWGRRPGRARGTHPPVPHSTVQYVSAVTAPSSDWVSRASPWLSLALDPLRPDVTAAAPDVTAVAIGGKGRNNPSWGQCAELSSPATQGPSNSRYLVSPQVNPIQV